MNLNFSEINVLLIGDYMLDEYIYGYSNRQSPEAQVPVMKKEQFYCYPGGAGNVAMNLKSLGASVTCLGYVGNDNRGKLLIEKMKNEEIDCSYISTEETITTLKTRYFVNGVQILRIDDEEILKEWKPKSISQLNFNSFDVIILSDYNKGVLNNDWFKEIEFQNIITDPKKDNFLFYSNSKIITPNLNELQRATNIDLKNLDSVKKACHKILSKTDLEYIIAKMGEKGMIIAGKDNFAKLINPHIVKDPDVTGAGDTVIAAFALAYSKFKNVELAAEVANAAGSIAVSKSQTVAVKIKEIESLLSK